MEKAFLSLNKTNIDILYHVKLIYLYMAKSTIAKSKDEWPMREEHNHFMVKELISL